jgi:sec-independent protein translocase protein TatA
MARGKYDIFIAKQTIYGFNTKRKKDCTKGIYMFGIGMPELIIILVIALLVIGPHKLPELAKSLGKGLAEFKKASEDFQRNIQEESRKAEEKPVAPAEQVVTAVPPAEHVVATPPAEHADATATTAAPPAEKKDVPHA